MKVVTFIYESVVAKNLREATLQAYPNPNHFYNLHLRDFRTHPVRVILCLILVVAKLSNSTIKHRLRWALSEWKVHIQEILYRVIQEYTSSFYTALHTQVANHVAAYTPQSYDGNDIL